MIRGVVSPGTYIVRRGPMRAPAAYGGGTPSYSILASDGAFILASDASYIITVS